MKYRPDDAVQDEPCIFFSFRTCSATVGLLSKGSFKFESDYQSVAREYNLKWNK